MKKTPLLNSRISSVISGLGHLDTIVIADAGLPIPNGCIRIDLAITPNFPSFVLVLKAVLLELQVEKYIIAKEASDGFNKLCSKEIYDSQNFITEFDRVSHDEFKTMLKNSKAVIRTGECTPYNNIILVSAVTFFDRS